MMTLCADYGERYVGLAITDPEGRLALRHSVVDQKKNNALDVIANIVNDEGVQQILVGVPTSFSGEESDQTHVSLAFIERLRDVLGDTVPVEGVDELFTSKEARRLLASEGKGREEEHMEAARLMLEHYLKLA